MLADIEPAPDRHNSLSSIGTAEPPSSPQMSALYGALDGNGSSVSSTGGWHTREVQHGQQSHLIASESAAKRAPTRVPAMQLQHRPRRATAALGSAAAGCSRTGSGGWAARPAAAACTASPAATPRVPSNCERATHMNVNSGGSGLQQSSAARGCCSHACVRGEQASWHIIHNS